MRERHRMHNILDLCLHFTHLPLRDLSSCVSPPQMGPTSNLWTNQSRQAMTHCGDGTKAGGGGNSALFSN